MTYNLSPLILSLFPGIGLLDDAWAQEWPECCIVRGPDLLWGGDIKSFHPPAGKFDGVIGGPPCQAHSRLRHIIMHRYGPDALAEDLIPQFTRCIDEARPTWWLMEMVPDAPEPHVPGYASSSTVLNNRWLGEEQERKRRFTFGLRGQVPIDLSRYIQLSALECPDRSPAVLASGMPRLQGNRKAPYRTGKDNLHFMSRASHASVREAIRLQGLPEDFLAKSPLTVEGKQLVIGNGVPRTMGRAVTAAIRSALQETQTK